MAIPERKSYLSDPAEESNRLTDRTFADLDDSISRELSQFIPGKVFDAHTHVYRRSDIGSPPGLFPEGPKQVSIDTWRDCVGKQVGRHSLQGGLFLPVPFSNCDIDGLNDFVITQVAGAPASRGLVAVAPGTDRKQALKWLSSPGIIGFKPYYCLSTSQPASQSPIRDFLPDWAWDIANQKHLIIMLHLVKDKALADLENQDYVRTMCTAHPNARLILAHCARGFHAPNTVKAISTLRGLGNVWFDTSAICESAPIVAVLKEFGPSKLLWGSDFPFSEMRGRCVTVGDSFAWIAPDRVSDGELAPICRPTLIGLEALRAMKEAAEISCLTSDDLADVFHGNAVRLLGLRE